jgi:Cu/Ag efflux pump CusA
MKRWILVVLIALALAAVVVIEGFTQTRLDALPEPSHLEALFATQAKHLLVGWSSREGIPAALANLQVT